MKAYVLRAITAVGLCAVLGQPGVGGTAWAAEPEMVPLKLTLPRPLFQGTPVPVNLPNLEKPLGKPRPDMLVPAGTVKVSEGKPVISSDPYPVIGDLELVTDGDNEGTEGSFVELGPGLQWVQVDLEQPVAMHAIVVWHFHAQARAYHDVVVQVSDDPDFQQGVKTVYNADHDNSSGMGVGKDMAYVETSEGRLIDPKGATGRYVRLYSRGNTSDDMNHYVEVEVYGIPAS
jgi:hypothetical protein